MTNMKQFLDWVCFNELAEAAKCTNAAFFQRIWPHCWQIQSLVMGCLIIGNRTQECNVKILAIFFSNLWVGGPFRNSWTYEHYNCANTAFFQRIWPHCGQIQWKFNSLTIGNRTQESNVRMLVMAINWCNILFPVKWRIKRDSRLGTQMNFSIKTTTKRLVTTRPVTGKTI